MKVLCLILCSIVATNAVSFYDLFSEEWGIFKTQFQKRYKTPEEEKFRFKIFTENKRDVEKHNKKFQRGEVTYQLGLNQFSDMLSHEIAQTLNGFKPRPNQQKRISKGGLKKITEVPESVDWVREGAVTPIKNQLTCGSCWAFSATGALEGRNFIKKGYLVSLSEQNLIDCSAEEGNQGCNGGTMDDAFKYVVDNHGIDTEKSYPYEGTEGVCRFNASAVGGTEVNFEDVPSGDEEALKAAVSEGPVSVAIDASLKTFQQYRGGIYQDPMCRSDSDSLDHGVLLVGYGYDERYEMPYWLIKNSWGTDWGEEGYIRLLRNENNLCGVTTSASYPVV